MIFKEWDQKQNLKIIQDFKAFNNSNPTWEHVVYHFDFVIFLCKKTNDFQLVGSKTKVVSSPGIEPGTFWLLVDSSNHSATGPAVNLK